MSWDRFREIDCSDWDGNAAPARTFQAADIHVAKTEKRLTDRLDFRR